MAKTPSTMLPLGTLAPDFALKDTDGSVWHLAEQPVGKALLVMFICNHCPYVVHVAQELARLGMDLGKLGVTVVAINANDAEAYPADGPALMVAEKAGRNYRFPYLYDATQAVAKAYQAACTPDFYLFDRDLRLVYRGQLDASRPGNGVGVTGADVRAAVTATLNGNPVSTAQTPSIGCNIKWRSGNAPSYHG